LVCDVLKKAVQVLSVTLRLPIAKYCEILPTIVAAMGELPDARGSVNIGAASVNKPSRVSSTLGRYERCRFPSRCNIVGRQRRAIGR